MTAQDFPQFIVYSHNNSIKAKSIRSMVSAIAFNYEARFMSSPTNSFAAKKLLLAYTKTDGPSTVRNPIVQQLLVRLVSAIPSIFRDRYEATMLESLFTMMYVALLRISEVSYTPKSSHNLRRKQLFLTHHKGQAVVKINMESCKFSKGQVFRMMVSPNMVSPQISPVESYELM